MARVKVNPRISKAERLVLKQADKVTGVYSDCDCVLIRAKRNDITVFFNVYDDGRVVEIKEDLQNV